MLPTGTPYWMPWPRGSDMMFIVTQRSRKRSHTRTHNQSILCENQDALMAKHQQTRSRCSGCFVAASVADLNPRTTHSLPSFYGIYFLRLMSHIKSETSRVFLFVPSVTTIITEHFLVYSIWYLVASSNWSASSLLLVTSIVMWRHATSLIGI